MKRSKSELNQPKNKLTKKTIFIGIFSGFVILYIFLTLQTVSSGGKLAQLEKQADDLKKQNRRLTEELVAKNSLTQLQEESSQLGFAKPQNTIYLTGSEAVAELR